MPLPLLKIELGIQPRALQVLASAVPLSNISFRFPLYCFCKPVIAYCDQNCSFCLALIDCFPLMKCWEHNMKVCVATDLQSNQE